VQEPNQTNYSEIKISNWSSALENTRFRSKVIAGVLIFAFILMLFPTFFEVIEARKGIILNDRFLDYITPHDFSIPIFIIIWSTTVLLIIRCINQPAIFLDVICCLVLLCIARMITIYLVPLDPPAGLIKIKDPLTSLTYGGKDVFITRDLFFSGHTSNMLMMALCFQKKSDKWFGYFAAFTVGILVLVQHVHYSIDVIGAFVITFFLVRLGKKLAAH
jgi:membrane-associated phospholipid phosphatase